MHQHDQIQTAQKVKQTMDVLTAGTEGPRDADSVLNEACRGADVSNYTQHTKINEVETM